MLPIKDDLTIHFLVRDEINTAAYAIGSTAPYASKVLVTDTGSQDGTWELLQDLKVHYPNLDIEQNNNVPDARDFRWNGNNLSVNFEPHDEIRKIRQSHIDRTETKYSWIVDADEVYCAPTLKRLFYFLDGFEDNDIGIYLPFLHFAVDHFHTADGFPFYGRIFKNDKLNIRGLVPYEQHFYGDTMIMPNTDGVSCLTSDVIHPVHHYQMVYKPYRRTIQNLVDYTGIQPEVYDSILLKTLTDKHRKDTSENNN